MVLATMPNKKSRFADVAEKSKAKRAELDIKTAARKAASLKEDANQAAVRSAREGSNKP